MDNELFPSYLCDAIPPFHCQDHFGENAMLTVKFFSLVDQCTWYVSEFDQNSNMFFGLIQDTNLRFGCFSLEDLRSREARNEVKRDSQWSPKTFREVLAETYHC